LLCESSSRIRVCSSLKYLLAYPNQGQQTVANMGHNLSTAVPNQEQSALSTSKTHVSNLIEGELFARNDHIKSTILTCPPYCMQVFITSRPTAQ
jgi:hypothetical protein